MEPRLNMAVYLNEVHFNPLFGNNDQDQYVEIRSDLESATLPQGTYLVVINGTSDLGTGAGFIHTVFDLSNQAFGSNGMLVLAESNNRYNIDSRARVLQGTNGFRGMPGEIFSTEVSFNNHIDFIVGTNTYLLIQSNVAPKVGDDIDANDDGTPDGVWNAWNVIDGFSAMFWVDQGLNGSYGYAPIMFRENGVGTSKVAKTVVNCEELSYVARIGDSVGYDASDWVGGNTVEDVKDGVADFRLQHGIFGTPRPYAFSGRTLDHVGASNFMGRISGTIFKDLNSDGIVQPGENPIPGVQIFADANDDGVENGRDFQIEPDKFASGQELTNIGSGVTLTVGHQDNTPIGFVVRTQDTFPAQLGNPRIFASEGIPWFDNSGRLRMDFYRPASSVTINFRGTDTVTEVVGTLEAFSANGTSLGKVRTGELFITQSQDITLSFGEGVIAYAVAYCDDSIGTPFGELDNLRYSIPDPSTVTDANGNYTIGMLAPGAYNIHAVAPQDLILQYPVEGSFPLTVTAAQSKTNASFSFLPNQTPVIVDQAFSIQENRVNGTNVGTIQASDSDLGQTVTLKILEGNADGAFVLVGNSIVLSKTQLVNFEKKNTYVLKVEAKDDYITPATATALVTINIQDVNDAPVITASNALVDENSSVGTVVIQPSAIDEDVNSDQNFKFQIASGNNSGLFAIDQATGAVTLKGTLDFESVSSYPLVITATDKGLPPATGRVTVTVTVRDVNEAPSILTSSLTVDENSLPGTALSPINATDPDNGQTLKLSIVGGSAANMLEFVGSSNQLSIRNGVNFDFEERSQWTVEVKVLDNGTPSLFDTKLIVLNVNDINDIPVVTGQTFQADENIPSSKLIGKVTATDQDAGQSLTYGIANGLDATFFRIDTITGEIFPAVGAKLNYEAKSKYVIQVEARDNALAPASGSALVTIQLSDRNDPPNLQPTDFGLDENSPTGTVVGTIHGQDEDVPDILTYTMQANDAFEINSSTGEIRVKPNAALDFEKTKSLTVQVTVTDQQNASSQSTVTVKLNDLNEAPVVVGSIPKQTIPPGPTWTFSIPTDVFKDNDAGDSLTFNVTDGDGFSLPSWLSYSSLTGKLTGTPSENEIGTTVVKVRATDRGALSAAINFEIEVANGWHNSINPLDVDGSNRISPLDPLLVINYLNLSLPQDAPKKNLPATYAMDVNNDQFITALDALLVINYINLHGSGEGEGEGAMANVSGPSNRSTESMDAVYALIAMDQERVRQSRR